MTRRQGLASGPRYSTTELCLHSRRSLPIKWLMRANDIAEIVREIAIRFCRVITEVEKGAGLVEAPTT